MWLLGALIAACGTAVYVELGTVSCTINCSYRMLNLFIVAIGITAQWRREELSRIYLPAAEVLGDMRSHHVCSNNGEQNVPTSVVISV